MALLHRAMKHQPALPKEAVGGHAHKILAEQVVQLHRQVELGKTSHQLPVPVQVGALHRGGVVPSVRPLPAAGDEGEDAVPARRQLRQGLPGGGQDEGGGG